MVQYLLLIASLNGNDIFQFKLIKFMIMIDIFYIDYLGSQGMLKENYKEDKK